MKKVQGCIVILLVILTLSGCAKPQAVETSMSPGEMASVIMESQPELPALDQITPEDENFNFYLNYYHIEAEQVEDGVICYTDDVEASEIVVLLLADEADCKAAEEMLNEYIRNRAGVFAGYAPQQEAMARDGIVAVNGRYIAMLICPDPSAAKTTFLGCFGDDTEAIEESVGTESFYDGKEIAESAETESFYDGKEVAESAETENLYDAEAVLQAWRSGNDSALSEVNRSILDAARKVIESEIDDSMSDYEKELAIHDFITGWSSFDYSVFGRSASDGFEAGSDTPYGVLIDQSAMCHGYSSAFQLFMDMLDIECITVFGVPGSNGVEHSWNMVKLDGEWYCVDAAWDDPIGGSPCHTYFNVTSEYLRKGSIHRWDDTSVPEATGTEYAYGNH